MTLPTAQYKEITPEIATEMLAKNKRNYRKLSKTKVEVLARELRANEWLSTTQGVGFDTDDKLIDGQHRLSAIVATNITVPSMLVCYGLTPKAKYKIDVGNKRTFADLTGLPTVVIASVRVPFRAVLSGNGRMGIVKGRPASTTGIALSIMNDTCSEEEGLNIFNKLVDLRQNAKGVFINRSLSKRREIEATLPLLLQSLIEKIRQGLTPVYDQKTGTYTDVKETPRELATKLMFLTMQALDSTMNYEENFVSPCHATVVKTLNLK